MADNWIDALLEEKRRHPERSEAIDAQLKGRGHKTDEPKARPRKETAKREPAPEKAVEKD